QKDLTVTSCWIEEVAPTTAHANAHPIQLNGASGAQKKAFLKFDVSTLANKKIKSAFLRLIGYNTPSPTDAYRTVTISNQLRAWTTAATWNTYDGTNAWGTPGGMNATTDETPGIVAQKVFRPAIWCDNFFIDVTELVKGWVEGSLPNNGLGMVCDADISFFLNLSYGTGFKPSLVVQYTDTDTGNGQLTDANKLKYAVESLSRNRKSGNWSWTHGGISASQANAIVLGWGYEYREALSTFFNRYISSAGAFQNGAETSTTTYYSTTCGSALIKLYQRTLKPQYLTALQTMRGWADTYTKSPEGIILEKSSNHIISELAYCLLDFLASYGDAFNDSTATDLAVNQGILLYDKLISTESDGIPRQNPKFPASKGWARGMGWLIAGLGKVLSCRGVKAHTNYNQLLTRYQSLVSALVKYQHPSGMWRNIVHDASSKFETSGTAIIALGIEYGVQSGSIDIAYSENVNRALTALSKYSLTGMELRESFPSNKNNVFSYTDFSSTDFGFGFWMELLTKVKMR
ncbi:glycoside hydrolase family 88 protein, partial [Paenibacillus naphthalenovorans]|uniref:glycoside hydrolase family 88 protein n=1 Tax=Paenibacillus naphthalenovorans TaxID=162209 RepID=UPI003D29398C